MQETLEFVVNEKKRDKIMELIGQGYSLRCLGCNEMYKDLPGEYRFDGHVERFFPECSFCGCDLFQSLKETVYLEASVKPKNGMLVFKEHHCHYCKCKFGKIWTGDAETECCAEFEILEEDEKQRVCKCLKSGLTIMVLKSSKEEMQEPDEMGCTFRRIPG